MPNEPLKRFAAVYTEREDGDFDLFSVLSTEHFLFDEFLSQSSGARNAAEQLASDLNSTDGVSDCRVRYFDELREIPDVLDKETDRDPET